jgi:hypothetical protein
VPLELGASMHECGGGRCVMVFLPACSLGGVVARLVLASARNHHRARRSGCGRAELALLRESEWPHVRGIHWSSWGVASVAIALIEMV